MEEKIEKIIAKEIRHIKELMEVKFNAVTERLDRMNGNITDNQKNIKKHDAILGKFGVVFTGIVFFFATACNFVFDWIKTKF